MNETEVRMLAIFLVPLFLMFLRRFVVPAVSRLVQAFLPPAIASFLTKTRSN